MYSLILNSLEMSLLRGSKETRKGCKRSAASNRIRCDGNNRFNYYVIMDLFRVRRNGKKGDDQQPRTGPEKQRCAVAFT